MSHENVEVFSTSSIAHDMATKNERGRLLTSGLSMALKQYTLSRGEVIPYEIHNLECQTVYVVEGMLGIRYMQGNEERTKVANVGEYFTIHNGTKHELANFADFPTTFVSIYSGPTASTSHGGKTEVSYEKAY